MPRARGRRSPAIALNKMRAMRLTGVLVALACLFAAVAIALGGCGGGSNSATDSPGSAESRPAPPKSDFPSAKGKTLAEVLESEGAKPSQLVVSPAARTFYKGENRFPFGVFQRDRTQVSDADVALYFAKVPGKPALPRPPTRKRRATSPRSDPSRRRSKR